MAYESSARSTSTYWARIALLKAVREVKPVVLDDLRALLPLFRSAKPYLEKRHSFAFDLWEWSIWKSQQPHASILPLRAALTRWANEHNIYFDWCLKYAIRSLIHWEIDRSSFDYGWCYKGHSSDGLGEDERRFAFELDEGWRTDLESREVFTKRATETFKKHLNTYLASMKLLLQERQHVEVRMKYKPMVQGFDDFKILALKLTCSLKYSEIVDLAVAQLELNGESNSEASVNEDRAKTRALRTAKLCGIDMEIVKERAKTIAK
jgi:hypothetical protein